jgi:signal transduction histidine kinase
MAAGDRLEESFHRGAEAPTFAQVNRRRSELWAISVALLATLAGVIALLFGTPEFLPEPLRLQASQSRTAAALVAALGIVFVVYVIEKEHSLRRLAQQLVDERVVSAGLSTRLGELARLSEVGRAVNETLQLPEVLSRIVSSALELLTCDDGTILLLTPEKSALVVATHTGPDTFPPQIELEGGYAAEVVRSRKPLLVTTVEGDRLSRDNTPEGPAAGSYMCVPLIHTGSLLGVLELTARPERGQFTPEDLAGLGFFGEYAAIAIANARFFGQERDTIKRLEELDSLKDDFAAMVSHELRSPLTAIIGAAKTLGRAEIELGAEHRADFLEMIYRQAEKMLHLAEDFLTAASIDQGMPKLQREQIDLRSLADQVVGDLKLSSHGRGRQVAISTLPSHPRVWGDSQAVRQVLTNLVENAFKYSPVDAPVKVRVRELPHEAVLEVSDEGKGIPSDQVTTIFERYRQVHDNGSRSIQGVGLGLFIVKRLVEAHRGSIEVESSEGKGSLFRVHLPTRRRT